MLKHFHFFGFITFGGLGFAHRNGGALGQVLSDLFSASHRNYLEG